MDHVASHVEEAYENVSVHAPTHHQPTEAKTARVLAKIFKRKHVICRSVSLANTRRELVKADIVIFTVLDRPE